MAIDMRTFMMKKATLTILVMMAVMMAFPALSVEAKAVRRLSAKQKTFSVGQEYTLKMKGLSGKDKKSRKKVRWTVSNKKALAVKTKTKYGITVHAKAAGTAKITGKYKGKKYTCRVTVKEAGGETDNDEDEEETIIHNGDVELNATDVSIYFIRDSEKDYIKPNPAHYYSYQFKVSGLKKGESVDWSIESYSSICCFKVNLGKVYMWRAPGYDNPEETAYLVAKLEDGTKLKAKLHGFSEINSIIDAKIADFKSRYITSGMTEVEKLKAVATYVTTEYKYDLYQSDWMYMVVSGGGDCYSYRWFVKHLCDSIGVKALACLGPGSDGMNLCKADGEMYIMITGFNTDVRGKYMLYKPSEETLKRVVSNSKIDLSYFD